MSTLRQQGTRALVALAPFIGPRQVGAIAHAMRGEEGDWFCEKMIQLVALIEKMPATYEQNDVPDPIVHLHYFIGSADFFITEKDLNVDGEGQVQAFGLSDLFHDGGELGYINIIEITDAGAELDFHFTPKPLSTVRASR